MLRIPFNCMCVRASCTMYCARSLWHAGHSRVHGLSMGGGPLQSTWAQYGWWTTPEYMGSVWVVDHSRVHGLSMGGGPLQSAWAYSMGGGPLQSTWAQYGWWTTPEYMGSVWVVDHSRVHGLSICCACQSSQGRMP